MRTQGQHLAELPRHFHALRGPYLKWAVRFRQPVEVCLAHYRRALIGWYEARIAPVEPFVGEVDHYVKEVAEVYFTDQLEKAVLVADRRPITELGYANDQNPLNHLPRPIQLNETQQLMLRLFQEQGKNCRELLLMADYHRLTPDRLAQVLNLDGQVVEVEERRRKCLLMVRESWQAAGITDPAHHPSPADEDRLDRYYEGLLDTTERWEVEARRSSDVVLRRAMELREDWAAVLTVAGRLDLMSTLQREETHYAVRRPTAPADAQKEIKLTPRRKPFLRIGSFQLPGLETALAGLLAVALAWLLYSTFGAAAPERKAVAHFEPFPNIFQRMQPRNEDERDLQRILRYYDRKDYLTAYDELLPVAPAYPAAPLYLGVSALALEQPTRALEWFAQIPEGNYYRPFAEWYEALAYLAEGRKPAAIITLTEISETPGHPYQGKARALLAEL
ncbi:hypothetical protein QWY85_17350 [Neolewinella lacunae]|uniref:Uncharacterized protein n=1 Tax=Neolewinella lacunae TaxID=1517758 RepID=A0A923PNB4_9BACT|nr:hypothetical protein [Neolewinella lacunae]MBC6995871.1 hypothetical protein [Neolewinella lacunae]MDN3636436.1 hypothetical protein [Neolewinella lacunae]